MATLEEIQNEKIITLGNLQAFYDKLNSDVVSNIHSQITSTNNAIAAVDTAVDALSETFDGHVTDNNNKFTEVNNKFTEVNNKITEIEGLVADNTEAISTEETRATNKEEEIAENLSQEISDRQTQDAATLEAAKSDAASKITTLRGTYTTGTLGELNTAISLNTSNLNTEITRATNAEQSLSDRIDAISGAVGDLNTIDLKVLGEGEYNTETLKPTITNPASNFIYLVPDSTTEGAGDYIEWLYVEEDTDFERIGTTAVDLANYALNSTVETLATTVSDNKANIEKSLADAISALEGADATNLAAAKKYTDDEITELRGGFTDTLNDLADAIDDTNTLITNEKTRAEGAEATLSQSITTEVADRKSGDATTLQSANSYTDEQIAALSNSTGTTTGNLETRVTANETSIANLGESKADLLSPALTGTPTAPTAEISVNNTQIATTAFVQNVITNYNTNTIAKTYATIASLNTTNEAVEQNASDITALGTTLAGHNNRITVLENLFEVADSVDDIITAANNAYPFS